MLFLVTVACSDKDDPAEIFNTPLLGPWQYCETEAQAGGEGRCYEATFEVVDDRVIDMVGQSCSLDWPAVSCWFSETTQDFSEYQDNRYPYPDETDALIGCFNDERTFVGKRVLATTWTPLDDRWEGGSLTRYDITATYIGDE